MATAIAERAATDLAASLAPTTTTAGESVESDVPTIETAAYQRSLKRWERNRDVYDGTEAIRAGGQKYLPAFKGESATLYDARRTISAVFNGYARTVDAVVGLICEPEPVLDEKMPATLVAMAENVDGAGMHLAVFTRRLVEAAMVDGFDGIITEYPRANDPRIDRSKASLAATVALETGAELDAADVAALGLMPYFILVKADEVLPIYETVNGKRTLVMLIRKEVATERKNRFGLVTVTRYRVYELTVNGVMYERWTVPSTGGTPVRDEGPTLMRNLKGIPWSPLALGKKKGENEYKPTLDDLAFLTLTHHRIATGILSLEENAFVPTPYRVGVKPNKDGTYPELVVGTGNTIEIPLPPQGVSVPNPVGYLSPPVDVLEPAMKSLENCKAEMGAMGAAFLSPQPVQETATAHRMDASAEKANISTVSRDTKDCLESAFGFAGQYIKETGGSITLNNDFVGEGIDPSYLAVIVQAYQEGGLSLEELRHVLQTGQLPEDFDSADVVELLAAQAAKRKATENAAKDALALANADATGAGGT